MWRENQWAKCDHNRSQQPNPVRTHATSPCRVELVVGRTLADVAALFVDTRSVATVVRVLALVDV